MFAFDRSDGSDGNTGASEGKSGAAPDDRRLHRRYGICLEVRWKLTRRRRLLASGRGVTLNMSSRGVLLETDQPLPGAGMMELSISWPVLLNRVAVLQLVVAGQMVRHSGRRVAMRISHHEFRTLRRLSGPRTGLRNAWT